MGSANDVLAYFDSLIARGVREVPDGSNCCEVTQEYGPVAGMKCFAWCAATCSNACKRAGVPAIKSALVAAWRDAAQKGTNGLQWIPRNGEIRRGDFVLYDWVGQGRYGDMHIAVVDNPGTQAKFFTKGGNEENRAMAQWRDRTYVMGFVRPAYDNAPTQGDDIDMASAQEIIDLLHTQKDHFEARLSEQHNELLSKFEIIAAMIRDDGGDVDVDKLAAALAKDLGDEVAKALGEKLVNG